MGPNESVRFPVHTCDWRESDAPSSSSIDVRRIVRGDRLPDSGSRSNTAGGLTLTLLGFCFGSPCLVLLLPKDLLYPIIPNC